LVRAANQHRRRAERQATESFANLWICHISGVRSREQTGLQREPVHHANDSGAINPVIFLPLSPDNLFTAAVFLPVRR
jgi:hypothetical protein